MYYILLTGIYGMYSKSLLFKIPTYSEDRDPTPVQLNVRSGEFVQYPVP
jgi:hypothetical protein